MADHLTEEEQIEALKRWWKDYWKSVVIPIVMVAVGYYGWNVYQAQKEANAEEGGLKYQQLIDIMETEPGQELSDDKKAQAKAMAQSIAEEFSGTLYEDQARLILARFAVGDNDLAKAAEQLQTVADSGENKAIQLLAKSRLARVKVSQGEFDTAIKLASGNGDSEFNSVFAEVRGDALAAQGNADAAATAYQEAIEKLDASQFSRRSIIQMKIDGVGILAGNVSTASDDDSAAPASDESANSETEEETPKETAEADAGAEQS